MAQGNKYADAHLHISLKHFVNGREKLLDRMEYVEGEHFPGRSTGLNYDQSDLITLRQGNVSLALAALYPMEAFVDKSWLAKNVIAKLFFGFKTKKVKELFNKFETGFDRLIGEYSYINERKAELAPGAILVKDKQGLDDEEKTKLVLTIEGGHALMGIQHPIQNRASFESEVLTNLDKIKQWEFPVFYLTLSHFEYNHLAGNSWAVPIPKLFQLILRETMDRLAPDDYGLSDIGKKVIDKCIDNSNGQKRIWIDLKHTHIEARYEVYKYFNEIGNIIVDGKPVPIPIIVSHAGVSGLVDKVAADAVDDRAREAKEKLYKKFNPLDINLCDEEIITIYKSGGMIGILLDQRILGAGNDEHKRDVKKRLKNLRDVDTKKRIHWKTVWHSVLFLDNLTRILRVLNDYIQNQGKPLHGMDAWEIICIGSDYDGIIDPVDNCPTARYFGVFEEELNKYFEQYVNPSDRHHIGLNNAASIKMALRKIFHENLERFVKDYFPV